MNTSLQEHWGRCRLYPWHNYTTTLNQLGAHIKHNGPAKYKKLSNCDFTEYWDDNIGNKKKKTHFLYFTLQLISQNNSVIWSQNEQASSHTHQLPFMLPPVHKTPPDTLRQCDLSIFCKCRRICFFFSSHSHVECPKDLFLDPIYFPSTCSHRFHL